jgi:hypothetical protein
MLSGAAGGTAMSQSHRFRRRVGVVGAVVSLGAGGLAILAPAANAAPVVGCSAPALVAAIDRANADPGPDVITLASGCTYQLVAVVGAPSTGLPIVTGEITVNGRGATIARAVQAPDFRLFTVSDTGSLTLNAMNLRNGRASDCPGDPLGFIVACGGAIENFGTLNINDTHLDGNNVNGAAPGGFDVEGGAIENFGTLNINRSRFDSNSGTTTGPAPLLFVAGGAISNEGTLSVDSTALTNNVIRLFGTGTLGGDEYQEGDGAAISSFGPSTITKSVINGNHTYGSAGNDITSGAVHNGLSTMTISATSITNNGATSRLGAAHGGGVISLGRLSVLTIRDSLISGNKVDAPALAAPAAGCVPESSSVASGGGVYVVRGAATITSTAVMTNSVRAEGGCGEAKAGGLHNQGGTMTLNAVAVLANSVFGDPASGGGIDNDKTALSLTIDRSTISGNLVKGSPSSGGGIANDSTGPITITRSHVSRNTPDNCSPTNSACTG